MIGIFRGNAPHRGITSAARLSLALAGVLAFATGCSQSSSDAASGGLYRLFNSDRNPGMETLENTVEYAIVQPSRAMVNAPEALIVFERNLGGAIEQRIILPNATAVRGDNVLHIRAQTGTSAVLDRFNFSDTVARFGGLPAPFTNLSEGSLQSGTDSLGTYVYARENVGANTLCVLVLRRLGVGARPLPRGTQALDVVMRNCVNGTLEQALAPMGGGALSVGGASGTIYTLSPHAAPRT